VVAVDFKELGARDGLGESVLPSGADDLVARGDDDRGRDGYV